MDEFEEVFDKDGEFQRVVAVPQADLDVPNDTDPDLVPVDELRFHMIEAPPGFFGRHVEMHSVKDQQIDNRVRIVICSDSGCAELFGRVEDC